MKQNPKKLLKNQQGMAHMSLVLVLIGSLFIGAAGYVYTRVSNAATATYINVGTYNLRSQRWDGGANYANWSTRKARVKAIITDHKPGIIGMQEVIKRNPDTGALVSQRNDVINFMTPMNYGYVVGSVNNSSPIFWKKDNFVKLVSGEYLIYNRAGSSLPDPPASRYLTYARLQQINHRKNVLVLNYHFNQFEQESTQLSRLASYSASLRAKYPNDDVFFAGDFNNRHDKVMAVLRGRGISLRVADKNTGVDHVLISSAVAVRTWLSTGRGDPPASDHSMIIAKLTI